MLGSSIEQRIDQFIPAEPHNRGTASASHSVARYPYLDYVVEELIVR